MRTTIVAMMAAIAFVVGAESRGQNDWQYPDPYFGILEIEKSRGPASDQRQRSGVRQPQRPVVQQRRSRWSATRQRSGGKTVSRGSPTGTAVQGTATGMGP